MAEYLDFTGLTTYNEKIKDYIQTKIDGLGSFFVLKGVKASASALPAEGNKQGDVWYVSDEQVGYIWIDEPGVQRWEKFGEPIDLTNYQLKEPGDLNTTSKNIVGAINEVNGIVANYSPTETIPKIPEPSTTTKGQILSVDDSGKYFLRVESGSSSIVVVQETGTSDTDVMSQKATTDAIALVSDTTANLTEKVNGHTKSIATNSAAIATADRKISKNTAKLANYSDKQTVPLIPTATHAQLGQILSVDASGQYFLRAESAGSITSITTDQINGLFA